MAATPLTPRLAALPCLPSVANPVNRIWQLPGILRQKARDLADPGMLPLAGHIAAGLFLCWSLAPALPWVAPVK